MALIAASAQRVQIRDPDSGHSVEVRIDQQFVSQKWLISHRFDDGWLVFDSEMLGPDAKAHAMELLRQYPIRQPYQHSKSILYA